MVTALDVPSEALDEAERRFVAKVREHGWFRTEIHGEDGFPGFSFTTGFWANVAQPELVMFGMNEDVTHDVFWDLFRDAAASKALPIGRRTNEVFSNLPAYVFSVAKQHYREHLGWSRWFYGGTDDFSCSQIVWPDRARVFPWESRVRLLIRRLSARPNREGVEGERGRLMSAFHQNTTFPPQK